MLLGYNLFEENDYSLLILITRSRSEISHKTHCSYIYYEMDSVTNADKEQRDSSHTLLLI